MSSQFTLADHIMFERRLIQHRDPHPVILRNAIINLMIWEHGSRDIAKINKILTGLDLLKEEADLAEDTEFYQAQIAAYEYLRWKLTIGEIRPY